MGLDEYRSHCAESDAERANFPGHNPLRGRRRMALGSVCDGMETKDVTPVVAIWQAGQD